MSTVAFAARVVDYDRTARNAQMFPTLPIPDDPRTRPTDASSSLAVGQKRRRSDDFEFVTGLPGKRMKRDVAAPMSRPATTIVPQQNRVDNLESSRRASYHHAPSSVQVFGTDSNSYERAYDYGYLGSRQLDAVQETKYMQNTNPSTTPVESGQSPYSATPTTTAGYAPSFISQESGVVGAYPASLPRHLNHGYAEPYPSLSIQTFSGSLPQDTTTSYSREMNAPSSAYSLHSSYSSATQAPVQYATNSPLAPSPSLADPRFSNDITPPLDPESANSAASWGFYSPDPTLHLKIQSLPVLDNLAKQILSTLSRTSLEEITRIILEPDSGQGQGYATLVSLFEDSRRLYVRETPFIDQQSISLGAPDCQEQVRRANLASFFASIFSTQNDLFQLHDNCLDIFVPIGSWLTWQGELLLQLKIQAYVTAVVNGTLSPMDALNHFFPMNMEQQILARHADGGNLIPEERNFISRLMNCRQTFMIEQEGADTIQSLPNKYPWTIFLREACAAVSRLVTELNIESPRTLMETGGLNAPVSGGHQSPTESLPSGQVVGPQQPQSMGRDVNSMRPPDIPPYMTGSMASNAYIPRDHRAGYSSATQHPNMSYVPLAASPVGTNTSDQVPTTPTQILYERAREAANTKASPPCRRPGTTSQRRPWSIEEERALMDGLDRVKGPHWSQILALYGAGGTMSEVLKDRNQVQLKDKARNLKLFFLKSGIDVPYYLQSVTGELKTRAPAQAAKREKEQLAKAALAAGQAAAGPAGIGLGK